jgi:uncharacterized protein YqgC (DUF456 family)
MDAAIALWILALVLVLVGLAGLILPALPGIPLIYAGLFLAAWAEDFAHVGWVILLVLGLLALISYGIDFAATAMGARKFGASPRAIWGAAIGTLVGIFFGLPGIMLGPFLGALVAELTSRDDMRAAARAGIGATLGLLFGVVLKIALAFTMLGVFVLARLV